MTIETDDLIRASARLDRVRRRAAEAGDLRTVRDCEIISRRLGIVQVLIEEREAEDIALSEVVEDSLQLADEKLEHQAKHIAALECALRFTLEEVDALKDLDIKRRIVIERQANLLEGAEETIRIQSALIQGDDE